MDDRSKKDNKFVNPLDDSERKQEEEGREGSDFSISGGEEDEEMSHNNAENHWDRIAAEKFYKSTKEEIEHKYMVE